MEPDKIISEINRLSVSQRLILAQDIWDSIAHECNRLPISDWQKDELEKRYSLFKQGELGLHDWNEVHGALRKRHA